MKLNEKYKTLFNSYHVNTPLRIANFMAQIEHESGLKPISENLNYSKDGLLKTFPKYFNSNNANFYARKPELIANKVYCNRMGNGNYESGDGWKYRGRGIIQITGKYNYDIFGISIKQDFINAPDLLLLPEYAIESALWFWVKNTLNDTADKGADDSIVQEITKRINGGLTNISDRIKYFHETLTLLNS